MANPTFGEKENVIYQPRYGVYAVIPDAVENTIDLSPSSQWYK